MSWVLWSFSTISPPGFVGALACPLPELLTRKRLVTSSIAVTRALADTQAASVHAVPRATPGSSRRCNR